MLVHIICLLAFRPSLTFSMCVIFLCHCVSLFWDCFFLTQYFFSSLCLSINFGFDVFLMIVLFMVCKFYNLILYTLFEATSMANCILVNVYPSGQYFVPLFQGQGFLGTKEKIMLIFESDKFFNIILGNPPCLVQHVAVGNDSSLITDSLLFEKWKIDHIDWVYHDKVVVFIKYLRLLACLC